MNNRWSILMAAFAVLVILTALPARHAQPLTKLSDHQMSKVVGGEKEMSCAEQYDKDSEQCRYGPEWYRIGCNGYVAAKLAWCEIKAAVNWVFSLF
jgi:hypothetical protein